MNLNPTAAQSESPIIQRTDGALAQGLVAHQLTIGPAPVTKPKPQSPSSGSLWMRSTSEGRVVLSPMSCCPTGNQEGRCFRWFRLSRMGWGCLNGWYRDSLPAWNALGYGFDSDRRLLGVLVGVRPSMICDFPKL